MRAVRAFTLIEILVVIAILGLLAALVASSWGPSSKLARTAATDARLNNLASALTGYQIEYECFPPSSGEWWRPLVQTGPRGDVFIKEMDLHLPPTGPLRLPRDAWDSPIEYVYPVDNDAAGIFSADPGGPPESMSASDTLDHCVLISPGPDRLSTPAVPGRTTNAGAYEAAPGNADNRRQKVHGK